MSPPRNAAITPTTTTDALIQVLLAGWHWPGGTPAPGILDAAAPVSAGRHRSDVTTDPAIRRRYRAIYARSSAPPAMSPRPSPASCCTFEQRRHAREEGVPAAGQGDLSSRLCSASLRSAHSITFVGAGEQGGAGFRGRAPCCACLLSGDNPTSRTPIERGDATCCARAADGHAAAAPPRTAENSRRLMLCLP